MRVATSWVWAAMFCAALTGCAQHSTSEPPPSSPWVSQPPFTGNFSLCAQGTGRVVGIDDVPSEIGFSARHALEHVSGHHAEPIRWTTEPALSLTPTEAGAIDIQVHVNGDILLMDPQTDEIGHGVRCTFHFQIPVNVTLQTPGRALNESFSATLYVEDPAVVYLRASIEVEQLGGALDVLTINDSGVVDRPTDYTIGLGFSRFGVSGALSGSGPAFSAVLANIGPADCGDEGIALELGDDVDGTSGQDLIDAITGVADVAITWSDNTTTRAQVEFEGDPFGTCTRGLNSQPGSIAVINAGGTLRMRTDDGRLNGSYPVYVTNGGAAGGGGFEAHGSLPIGNLPATTPDQVGFPAEPVADFDRFSSQVTLSARSTGAVRALTSLTGFHCRPPTSDSPNFCQVIDSATLQSGDTTP